jgi:DnaJ-class molecular chaperone
MRASWIRWSRALARGRVEPDPAPKPRKLLFGVTRVCPTCKGKGSKRKNICGACRGSGVIDE